MASQEVISAILTGVVPALVAAASVIIAWQMEKLRSMREQLSEKKCLAYAEAVKMFYSVLKNAKTNQKSNSDEMMRKMIEMKRDIFMYGSDKVFNAFNTWLLSVSRNDDKAQLSAFLDFALEMRRDMCNNKTKLTKRDILLNLTQSEVEANKIYD